MKTNFLDSGALSKFLYDECKRNGLLDEVYFVGFEGFILKSINFFRDVIGGKIVWYTEFIVYNTDYKCDKVFSVYAYVVVDKNYDIREFRVIDIDHIEGCSTGCDCWDCSPSASDIGNIMDNSL